MREANVPLRVLPTEVYFDLVREMLLLNGQACVRVTGTSMQPLLHHLRDEVILIQPEKVRQGDIVLFDRRDGRYALHRVIRSGKDTFTMAGDNQWHVEEDLPCGQIVGVVSAVVRDGRRIECSSTVLRLYAQAVTLMTFPRIRLRRVLSRLLKLSGPGGAFTKKGERR